MAAPRKVAFVLSFLGLMSALSSEASTDIRKIRELAARDNVTCILVFGDSSVDPGNNDYFTTTVKGNFPPYGKDFFSGRPTGRFSNGRLATDFIAEALGSTKAIPPFLDPKLSRLDLLHGVSFASAASGYDELTANISGVLPVYKQLNYLLHYKVHLRKLVGRSLAEKILHNSIFVMSMGTNDFLLNYYIDPTRSAQYTIEEYQDFLVTCMSSDIKEMYRLGARRMVIVGIPPLGCMPLVRTLAGTTGCYENYNNVSSLFNSKISTRLDELRGTLGIKTVFLDANKMIMDAINNPQKYGMTETSKGCCGTGTIEYGDTCKGLTTCLDPDKYVFWDAVHPTQKMYQNVTLDVDEKIVSDEICAL
ncbi:hypothetical protein MLD38_016735 [Melastoma candidum]|uniref:Uncharacterized protein n=1 Tax=Melastoma candidum TaxID=119954 RepID=A0ACB9QN96_9MYRT|nr:hypothetical protein MLD38_016735 [Melastoma candidum]